MPTPQNRRISNTMMLHTIAYTRVTTSLTYRFGKWGLSHHMCRKCHKTGTDCNTVVCRFSRCPRSKDACKPSSPPPLVSPLDSVHKNRMFSKRQNQFLFYSAGGFPSFKYGGLSKKVSFIRVEGRAGSACRTVMQANALDSSPVFPPTSSARVLQSSCATRY